MKKFGTLCLALLMALSLCACGGGEDNTERAEAVAQALDGYTWGANAGETVMGTVNNFAIFTTDEDIRGGGGDIEFIATLDDAVTTHYWGTFAILQNDPNQISVTFMAEIESDGTMTSLDSPRTEKWECVYEDGAVEEIHRLDDEGEDIAVLTILED